MKIENKNYVFRDLILLMHINRVVAIREVKNIAPCLLFTMSIIKIIVTTLSWKDRLLRTREVSSNLTGEIK